MTRTPGPAVGFDGADATNRIAAVLVHWATHAKGRKATIARLRDLDTACADQAAFVGLLQMASVQCLLDGQPSAAVRDIADLHLGQSYDSDAAVEVRNRVFFAVLENPAVPAATAA